MVCQCFDNLIYTLAGREGQKILCQFLYWLKQCWYLFQSHTMAHPIFSFVQRYTLRHSTIQHMKQALNVIVHQCKVTFDQSGINYNWKKKKKLFKCLKLQYTNKEKQFHINTKHDNHLHNVHCVPVTGLMFKSQQILTEESPHCTNTLIIRWVLLLMQVHML